MPYLFAIASCLKDGTLKPKTEIGTNLVLFFFLAFIRGHDNAISWFISHKQHSETSWRSILTPTMLKVEKPRIECKGIHYELIFTLLTYGYTCSLLASSIFGNVKGEAEAGSEKILKKVSN